jgi:hypothetical protein
VRRADACFPSDPSDHELMLPVVRAWDGPRPEAPRGNNMSIPGRSRCLAGGTRRVADGDACITDVLHVRSGASGKGSSCLSFLWETKMEGLVKVSS